MVDMADQSKEFDLEIICPDRIFYTGKTTMVELNTVEGELGVYKNHIPLTTVLDSGVISIHDDEGMREAAVHAGFVEIRQEKMTILAEIAEWPEEIDLNRAEKAKERAEERIKRKDSRLDIVRAESALKRAMTRLNANK